jgi:hypothetical protein
VLLHARAARRRDRSEGRLRRFPQSIVILGSVTGGASSPASNRTRASVITRVMGIFWECQSGTHELGPNYPDAAVLAHSRQIGVARVVQRKMTAPLVNQPQRRAQVRHSRLS